MRITYRLPLALLAGVLALSSVASAQSMEEKLAAKLKKPFIQNAEWVQDYDEALKQSKASGKLIFGYFTRSYSP